MFLTIKIKNGMSMNSPFRCPFQYPKNADNSGKSDHCLRQFSKVILYFDGGVTNKSVSASLVIKIHSKGQYLGVT